MSTIRCRARFRTTCRVAGGAGRTGQHRDDGARAARPRRAAIALEPAGHRPEDLRKSRLVAGSAVARLDNKTAIAFGFAEGAKAMERRLTGAAAGSFLIANDSPAIRASAAKRNGSIAVRRTFGRHRRHFLRRNRQRVAGGQDQRDRFALSL